MMGHNCNCCKHESRCKNYVPDHVNMPVLEMRYDTHPSDLHPCEHGKPIVASAVARYEFAELGHGDVHAYHAHDDIVFHDAWLYRGGSAWSLNYAKFCSECGLLTATAEQLPEMYERWQHDHDAKEG
jgi:hypothetical protein